MKTLLLFFILFIFTPPIEVSIWADNIHENFDVYNNGEKVTLLDTSTPKNRRFYVENREINLMLIHQMDTCYINRVLSDKHVVLVACFD